MSWATLGVLVVAGVALLVWAGRETLFTVDDLLWFMGSPRLDLEGMLQPHNGHLIATSRLVYLMVFELFGPDYGAIRVLTALAAGLTSVVFFAWASRRAGPALALAGSALLLVLGPSYIFLIAGDGLMVQLSLSAGLGALLALERRDRVGDVVAGGLLCFAIVTYSIGLAFVVAVAIAVCLGPGRRARAWVPALPAIVYGAWWIWSQGQPNAPGDGVDPTNVLSLPAYAFQALASVLGALTGLDYDFTGEPIRPEFETTAAFAGPALALLAIAGVVWRLCRRPVPSSAWVALGFLVPLLVLAGLTNDAASPPDSSRFVYFFAAGTLMVGAACAEGLRLTRGHVIAVWAIAACGVAVNVLALSEGGDFRREVDTPQMRAELTGIELAAGRAQPRPGLANVAGGAAVLSYPFALAPIDDPSGDYLAATAKYGELGYSLAELRGQAEELRARTDAVLLGAYRAALEPYEGPNSAGCERLRASEGQGVAFELPADGALVETGEDAATVGLARFAGASLVPLGELEADAPASLVVPPDGAPDPWRVSIGATSALVCKLPPA